MPVVWKSNIPTTRNGSRIYGANLSGRFSGRSAGGRSTLIGIMRRQTWHFRGISFREYRSSEKWKVRRVVL